MTLIAVLSHPARVTDCARYLTNRALTEASILICPDSADFRNLSLLPNCELHFIKKHQTKKSIDRYLRFHFGSQLRTLLRNGSRSGLLVERFLSKVVTVPRIYSLRQYCTQQMRPSKFSQEPAVNNGLLSELTSLHAQHLVSEIVTFDVIDLPTLLKFVDVGNIPLKIR